MRKVININQGWHFARSDIGLDEAMRATGERVNLPHTWNADDGQDGGDDYYRGVCWYTVVLDIPATEYDDKVYIEFLGVNATAQVYLNGSLLCCHAGGYSTFRAELTGTIAGKNILCVSVDNAPSDSVYPQKADFTFYGGIYRDVNLIVVPAVHFSLEHDGTNGLKVTPVMSRPHNTSFPYADKVSVRMEAWVCGAQDGSEVLLGVQGVGEISVPVKEGKAQGKIEIQNARLWDGIDDPYLYTACAMIGQDKVSARFGCRTFGFDAERGFMLNGRSYPLRGVSRHQDRQGVGNAITRAMMDEDMALIREMGANTIRLAHYQHDQYFYDLCDESGMLVWAEIPYITCHMPSGRENTVSQMRELVAQNYNHASIMCWGLSNEITAHGGVTQEVIDNHEALNHLCHELDPTRPTAMAHAFMLAPDNAFVRLADICSYNLYYGWYLGELTDNDEWFDAYHSEYPHLPIGLSEYGADANLQYQTATPVRGDYTEQYQALYHEHILKMLSQRPYIWASHAWNMFDFGADGRSEGGRPGVNQKGLVSFDRKTKKDAFFIYKAYFSNEPFVHICGRRYIERHEEETQIKVYSNQAKVTLYIDGSEIATLEEDKVFVFHAKLSGEHTIEARSGNLQDSIRVRRVGKPNKSYILEDSAVINWLENREITTRKGFFSIKDTLGEISATPQGAMLIQEFMQAVSATRGDVAVGVVHNEAMQKALNAATVESILRQAGSAIGEDTVVRLNRSLQELKKQ